MDNLNVQQLAAVNYNGKHLLLLAGAGTGKTRTIIARAKHLIETGVAPHKILILSFTKKSANEIVNRIATELDKTDSDGLVGQTFHSWCMSIIKSNPHIFPQASYTVLDEDDQESCIKLLCGRKWNSKNSDGKKIQPEAILAVYSYAINAKCSLSDAIRMVMFDNAPAEKNVDQERTIMQGVIKMYLEYKKSRKYLDYDDILLTVSKTLLNNPQLRHMIAGLYDHILIDEMQDTNPLQYELLSSFYDDCHLFCVGDDAQSIYAFRGADFKTVHRFAEIVPEAETLKLTINYRSTQEILDLSNWLLEQSPLNYDKKLVAARGKGIKPQIIHWDSEWDEGRDIVTKMIEGRAKHGLKWKDNLALGRSKWSLRKVESFLIKEKIPYKLFGGTGIMASKHIRDVVSPLRIVANYLDEIAWSRYLQLWANIGPSTAAKIIGEMLEEDSLDEAIYKLEQMNLQKQISETLQRISDLQYNPSKAISEALEVMTPRLKELYKDEWSWRSEDFPLLMEVAKSSGSIMEFIAEYVMDPKLETTGKESGKDDDCVILSTIHSAKGLEADSVYLVNASTRSYPTPRAILNGEDAVEEERRCLYVALTRAKNMLFVYRDVQSIHTADDESKDYFLNMVPERLYESVSIAKYTVDPRKVNLTKPISEQDIYSDFNFD